MTTKRHTLYVFDFDGTLTTSDTLIEFIRYANGTWSLVGSLFLMLPKLLMMKLHLRDNGQTKEELFARHFKGMTIEAFDEVCQRFAAHRQALLRPKGVATMRRAMEQGARVLVVSASVDNWVAPFFPDVDVQGTQAEVTDGRLTGRFLTRNCYGQEKVNRLKQAVPELKNNRQQYYIVAFGDSRGDKEMLEFADERHYKPFRK